MVMEAVIEDMGDEGGTMQCLDHPFKNHHTPPGGICAFCLQEKLGKLVSSSFPVAIFPSSSSSPSPSFRSDSSNKHQNTQNNPQTHHSTRSRLPFFASSSHKKDHMKNNNIVRNGNPPPVVFKRSKSTSTAAGGGGGVQFFDSYSEFNSPRKRGFWSFLRHHNTSNNSNSNININKKTAREICYGTAAPPTASATRDFYPQRSQRIDEDIEEQHSGDSPNHARVSRSRSVGCGSRSFSGDFFERISTGFGDCTLRRVESQREGNNNKPRGATPGRRAGGGRQHDCIKERVKCGGIFSGFMIASSSSSSSSSSSYWVSSSSAEAAAGNMSHGRSKSWGWALASPIRGFSSKPPLKREGSSKNNNGANATPNLNAIPSLLTVGS